MNLGRKLIVIGSMMIVSAYVPIILSVFGVTLHAQSSQNSHIGIVFEGHGTLIRVFMSIGASLVIAGVTYRFWRGIVKRA